MALIRSSLDRRAQPQQAGGVNWANPITRSMTVCLLPATHRDPRDLSRPRRWSSSMNPRVAPGGGIGWGLVLPSLQGASYPAVLSSFPVTLGLVWVAASATTAGQHLWGLANSTVASNRSRLGMRVGSLGGIEVFSMNALGTTQAVETANAYSAVAHNVAVATLTSSSSRAIYLNGGAPSTSSASNVPTGIDTTCLGVSPASGADLDGAVGHYLLAVLWQRTLDSREIYSFMRNPWQVLAPRRTLTMVRAPGLIPVLSAATAVSVSSSQATPRVTVTY